MSFFWSKRKQVKIPVHGEEWEGEKFTSFLSILSGYVKVTWTNIMSDNRFPIQSFLFCIKASLSSKFLYFLYGKYGVLDWFLMTMEFNLFREVVIICFNRRLFLFLIFLCGNLEWYLVCYFPFFLARYLCISIVPWKIMCSSVAIIFRPCRTDNRIRSSRLIASGV